MFIILQIFLEHMQFSKLWNILRNSPVLAGAGVSLSFCAGGQWGFSAGHF